MQYFYDFQAFEESVNFLETTEEACSHVLCVAGWFDRIHNVWEYMSSNMPHIGIVFDKGATEPGVKVSKSN